METRIRHISFSIISSIVFTVAIVKLFEFRVFALEPWGFIEHYGNMPGIVTRDEKWLRLIFLRALPAIVPVSFVASMSVLHASRAAIKGQISRMWILFAASAFAWLTVLFLPLMAPEHQQWLAWFDWLPIYVAPAAILALLVAGYLIPFWALFSRKEKSVTSILMSVVGIGLAEGIIFLATAELVFAAISYTTP